MDFYAKLKPLNDAYERDSVFIVMKKPCHPMGYFGYSGF